MKLYRIVSAALLMLAFAITPLLADEPRPLGDGEFAKMHQMIKPQLGESRWMEIDWYPTVWEARKRAAAEGKPIFLMAGSGGAPAAGC